MINKLALYCPLRQDGEVVFPEVPNIPNFWSLPPSMQKVILEQIEKGVPEE